MTGTEKLLLAAAVGLAIVACVYYRKTEPQRKQTGGPSDALASLAGLPDPKTVALGTTSSDGRWIVVQARTPGAQPRWQSTGAVIGGLNLGGTP